MSLLSQEEKDNLTETLVHGLPLPDDMPIDELTMQIWQNVAELPYPVESDFNIIGKSAIVHILNENHDRVMRLDITPEKINFKLLIPKHKLSRDDSAVSAFGVMATVGAWNEVLDSFLQAK